MPRKKPRKAKNGKSTWQRTRSKCAVCAPALPEGSPRRLTGNRSVRIAFSSSGKVAGLAKFLRVRSVSPLPGSTSGKGEKYHAVHLYRHLHRLLLCRPGALACPARLQGSSGTGHEVLGELDCSPFPGERPSTVSVRGREFSSVNSVLRAAYTWRTNDSPTSGGMKHGSVHSDQRGKG